MEPAALDRPRLARLVRADAGYALAALLILAVGALCVRYGLKGTGYYLHTPWFWAHARHLRSDRPALPGADAAPALVSPGKAAANVGADRGIGAHAAPVDRGGTGPIDGAGGTGCGDGPRQHALIGITNFGFTHH